MVVVHRLYILTFTSSYNVGFVVLEDFAGYTKGFRNCPDRNVLKSASARAGWSAGTKWPAARTEANVKFFSYT